MEAIAVVTSRLVGKQEVTSFVQSVGGYWNDEPTLNQGVVERGSARVFIDGETDISSAYFQHDRLEYLRSQLGADPQSHIAIHIGHGDGSKELAFEVARRMIIVWGGLIDDDRGNFIRPEQLAGH